jgi:Type VI secretion system/phage-baseplate injector OB domain
MLKDESGNRRFYGTYRGVVVDNNDPDGNRRLKLKVPQVLGEQITGWSWGIDKPNIKLASPAVGQGVLVHFEGGDPSFPIWSGVSGTNKSTGSDIYIKQFSSIPTSTAIKTTTFSDGTKAVDLVDTLTALSSGTYFNLDGGVPDSVYGGVTGIDGGGI